MTEAKITRRRCACCRGYWVTRDGADIGMVRQSDKGWKAGVVADDNDGAYVSWFAGDWRSRAFAVNAVGKWSTSDGINFFFPNLGEDDD